MKRPVLHGLQSCLAIEHEAIWLYAYLGARVPGVAGAARTSFDRHRRVRDELLALLADWQDSNPRPRSDYALGAAANAAQASSLARSVESRSAAAWLRVVGAATGSDRELALDRLRGAALAGLSWGGHPEPFPGLRT